MEYEEIKFKIRTIILESIDFSDNQSDESIKELINNTIKEECKNTYIPYKDRIILAKELFFSIRRLDILEELTEDTSITEIMINGKDNIFIEKEGKISKWNKSFESTDKLMDVIQQIVSKCNRAVNESSPIVDARLSNGSRVNIVLPPIALNGPIITIRRFPDSPITMENLIEFEAIDKKTVLFLEKLVKSKYNIFISGGTGSGKTTFLNTEATGRKNYSKELSHLKTVFKTAGRVLENRELAMLFQPEDISFTPNTLYKYYSDEEIKRFNEAVIAKDEQIARLMYVHQLLGTRISETLTLKQDCIFRDDDGRLMIRIYQIKSRRYYEKTINEDIKMLLEKAMEYTNSRYGKREYVFVSDADPDKPMQYGRLQYQLMVMVQENNLCDDSGRLFGVGTHIFRHNYGKRLTDLHESDETIARLLGHANTSSVHHYRKISNDIMTGETKNTRNQMDDKLREIMKAW